MSIENRIACRTDKNTLASIDAFTFLHLSLDLAVDFEAHTLSGTAVWKVKQTTGTTSELVLDTSSGLNVSEASINGAKVEHYWRPKNETFGTPVAIPIPASLQEKDREIHVTLQYKTSPECSALQWLPPAQTAGKERPYMFSQCQAIHARALLPCPDAPTAKFAYDAKVTVPDWATALMSAVAAGAPSKAASAGARVFAFSQPIPIPSYLVAIAVGDLRGIRVGPRTTVWAEPSVVDAAAWEFAETEAFIKTGEELLGVPYIWGQYDILCMPPSFPYGGMENPCLTFATPTLLAGDRSLANVICHEVAHSWTGNLVTNHTWEHFWLNEGWTRYLENRIQSRIAGGAKGEELYDFAMQESLTHLEDSVLTFGKESPLTALVPPLDGIDPDDAFSAVPYEKGLALLNYLAVTVGGRMQFEAFAAAYIQAFQKKTLTSADFRDFFLSYCEGKDIDASAVDWEAWLTRPGMPIVKATYPDALGASCTKLAERWMAEKSEADGSFVAEDYTEKPTQLKIHFLETLLARSLAADTPPMTVAALQKMDQLYDLTSSKNAELRCRWQRLCIRHRAAFIVPHVIAFVVTVGRMKFVRPLYRELGDWPEHRQAAVDTFKEHRTAYHPIAAKMIAQDLKITDL